MDFNYPNQVTLNHRVRLSDYLIGKRYINKDLCPCVFIKSTSSGFAIIDVYIDDMNLIGTLEELRDMLRI